jgi:hypothetical protein
MIGGGRREASRRVKIVVKHFYRENGFFEEETTEWLLTARR